MSLQNRQGILLLFCTLAIVLSVFLLTRPKHSLAGTVWFYDVAQGKLFPVARGTIPPVHVPGGGLTGVSATVYGCGSCDPTDLQIVYIEKFTDELATQTGNPGQPGSAAIDGGHWVAVPPSKVGAEPEWIPAASDEGQRLVAGGRNPCGEKPRMTCNP